MTLTRRRFLTISAGIALAPVGANAKTWEGRAFGADVSIVIRGETASAVLDDAVNEIRVIENLFSLFDPASAIRELNETGKLPNPDPRFSELMQAADYAHGVTNGLFDPTVQRLWEALAAGKKSVKGLLTIGWDKVQFSADEITLGVEQALTFNGIAQGYATDRVAKILAAHGLTDVLVNIGEHRGTGGPWQLGIEDPQHGLMGMRTLKSGAIATSSPMATPLANSGHIIHGKRKPQWSTVTVEARTATLADSLSTALVLAKLSEIAEIKAQSGVSRITLVDKSGDLITL